MMRHHTGALMLLVSVCLLAVSLPLPAVQAPAPSQNPPPGEPVGSVSIDVVVLDRDGRFVDTLGPADFTVTVDGKPRRVLWVRHVSRGPGAQGDAGTRQQNHPGTISYAAEPARNVLVVVDQISLARGDEKPATRGAGAFLDRLGLDDRVAVLPLPLPSKAQIALTTERVKARQALTRVAGQLVQSGVLAADKPSVLDDRAVTGGTNRGTAGDPDRTTGGEQTSGPPVTAMPAASERLDAEPTTARTIFPGLQSVLTSLRGLPGRKVVAVFTSGTAPQPGAGRFDLGQLNNLAGAASAAHAVIYAFGLPHRRADDHADPDLLPFEMLARLTGGAFVMLGKNPDAAVTQVMPELSSCYVLGLEAGPSDADGKRRAVRVQTAVKTAVKTLSLRFASWLLPRPDPGDWVAPEIGAASAIDPAPAPATATVAGTERPEVRADSRRDAEELRDEELQRLLMRLTGYVSGYKREYSALVAEEDYRQSTSNKSVRMRSDLLLVRPSNTDNWISFRDVFEVDGVPVRDRDDRLKRLFLSGTPAAQDQMKAIKDESSRHNIQNFERNINVPLFPMVFLEPTNAPRFRFKMGKTRTTDGVEARRIDYEEWARPTIITDRGDRDEPAAGWFLIDPVSGAIIETFMKTGGLGWTAELEIRFRRDGTIGLWVPAEMKETYKQQRGTTWTTSLDGRATYANFRRFQVTTEEKIKTP